MSIKSDKWIRRMAEEHGMIEPFEPSQIRYSQDGQKIVSHVFGAQQDQVVQQLGGVDGVSSGLIQKLLPILAPIVMAYIAKQLTGATSNVGQDGGLGGLLGGLLGGVLGGGAPAQQQQSGPDLGSILGGLLGGGTRH